MANISWSKAKKIILRDGQRCRYCGDLLELQDITFDHLNPKAYGGTYCIENLVIACIYCNNGRGTHNIPTLPQTKSMGEVIKIIKKARKKKTDVKID